MSESMHREDMTKKKTCPCPPLPTLAVRLHQLLSVLAQAAAHSLRAAISAPRTASTTLAQVLVAGLVRCIAAAWPCLQTRAVRTLTVVVLMAFVCFTVVWRWPVVVDGLALTLAALALWIAVEQRFAKSAASDRG